MATTSLSESDRDFLSRIARLACLNPFGEEAMDAVRGFGVHGSGGDIVLRDLSFGLRAALERVGGGKPPRFTDFGGKDAETLRIASAADVYAANSASFERLLSAKPSESTGEVAFPDGKEILSDLCRRGFKRSEAVGLIELFHQIHRASRFISGRLRGGCESMRKLRSRLWSNLFTQDILFHSKFMARRMRDSSLVIVGETGTGKGAAAQALAMSGFIPFDDRKWAFARSPERLFHPIVISEFPESLLESALFGHVVGAYTGATERRRGVFGRCPEWGTVFMDEAGEIGLHVQVKLLRVLQERHFTLLGGEEESPFEGRLVAATNRPFYELGQGGIFREDFLHRLCSDIVEMPTLRSRIRESPEELSEMLRHMFRVVTGVDDEGLVGRIRSLLEQHLGDMYDWPGNVRELEQKVRSILISGACEAQFKPCQTPDPKDGPYWGDVDWRKSSLSYVVDRMIKGKATADEILGIYAGHLQGRGQDLKTIAHILGYKDVRTVRKLIRKPILLS